MKKGLIQLFLLCVISTMGFAQVHDSTDLKDATVRNLGPAGMSGRVTCIDVVRSHPEHIFIGTASGGVWESLNGGTTWKPIFDDQPTLSIGALSIDPTNADIIYVGTGEGNPRNSHNSGNGLYKSADGGRTWVSLGLKNTKTIHRIIIDPQYPDIIYVGATGSAWGDSPDRGLYKSTDGGLNFEKILFTNDSTGIGDMVMDPSNPKKLLVATWQHRRKPWTFHSGGKASGIHLTYDGGKTFKKLTTKNGLPKGDLGRIGLAFAPSNPETVYALIEAKENALYKSTDGGHQWKKIGTKNVGNRPFYYSDIFVDPSNENRIFSLWSYVSLSEDGGKSFKTIMDYGNNVHPDHHALYIHPDQPNYIINGNDGGLNISRDGGKTWEFKSNIPVGQFYHVNYDTSFPYRIYGGMQDNGSWVGPSAVFRRGGIRNYDWQEIYFGDGFDVQPILSDDQYGYAMSQGGNVARYDLTTGRTSYVQPLSENNEKLRFNWNAAIATDPFNSDGLYFGSQFVHYSNDRGRSWSTISPDLTTNDTLKQKQHLSGGLTIDATKAENYTTILAITPSPFDTNTIWVSTDDGNLQVTSNRGESWQNISNKLSGLPKGSWIPQVISGQSENEYFIVANDYRRNNWSAYAYHTSNGGSTFNRIVDDADVEGFVCSIVQDHEDPNLLFLGTDVGLYFSLNKGANWSRWGDNFPHVQVRDLKIHPVTNDLIIGTFGRSLWVIDNISYLRNTASYNAKKKFSVLDVQPGYLINNKSYLGIRFSAQGEFIGDNISYGVARIFYYGGGKKEKRGEEKRVKGKLGKERKKKNKAEQEEKPKSKKGNKKGKDKIFVTVYDSNGDTLRNFAVKRKLGFQKIGWNMRRNGIDFPRRKDKEKDANPASGPRVSAGEYLTTLKYKNQLDSIVLIVKDDPRAEVDNSLIVSRDENIEQFYSIVKEVNISFSSLKKIKRNIDLLKSTWVVLPDSTQDTLGKILKPIETKCDSLYNLVLSPESQKGYQDGSNYLISKIWKANRYIRNEDVAMGENVQLALSQLEAVQAPVVEAINKYIEEEWKPYVESYQELGWSIFFEDLLNDEKE